MTNIETVAECVEAWPDGICDNCLEKLTGIRPHQQIVAICHKLAARGSIFRSPGVCSAGSESRLINKASDQRLRIPSRDDAAPVPTITAEQLDAFRRRLISILRKLDQTQTHAHEGFSAWVSRLRDESKIPQNTACLILSYAGFRNLVVYSDYILTPEESRIVNLIQHELQIWLHSEGT